MFSNLEDFYKFANTLKPILADTFVYKPTKEDLKQGNYFLQEGLWSGTENQVFVYDRKKLEAHKSTLLTLCKKLPKLQPATDDHAGIISSFDLLLDITKYPQQSPEEIRTQFSISNHFANFLCGSGIASVTTVKNGQNHAFLLILDKKYRSYFEKEGQEPYED